MILLHFVNKVFYKIVIYIGTYKDPQKLCYYKKVFKNIKDTLAEFFYNHILLEFIYFIHTMTFSNAALSAKINLQPYYYSSKINYHNININMS